MQRSLIKVLKGSFKSQARYAFSLVSDYNERVNQKLSGTHSIPETPKFFINNTRPSNFGDHIDMKVNIDNWFEENRLYNEEEVDIKRTQSYVLTAIYYAGLLNVARLYAVGIIGRLNQWKRYDKDTYMEMDIGDLPPGEVIQIVWNGLPVFIRRLTPEEVKEENELTTDTLLDSESEVVLTDSGANQLLVVSAKCTHLGCIPIPYLGAYKGWVCICHGSVYDKFGRVRQGPALQNLPYINNSIYGETICIEEMKFPREPSTRFWAP